MLVSVRKSTESKNGGFVTTIGYELMVDSPLGRVLSTGIYLLKTEDQCEIGLEVDFPVENFTKTVLDGYTWLF